jgi:hypothetical protein
MMFQLHPHQLVLLPVMIIHRLLIEKTFINCINYQIVRPIIKDIGYHGCFEATNGLNAFVESINATQCQSGANLYSSLSSSASFYCYIGGYHNFIDSEAMTIEMCTDLCITKSGFLYAGISE